MRPLLWLVLVAVSGMTALSAFAAGPYTALVFWIALVLLSFLAARWHARHNRSEAFDDKLSFERMDRAREWLIEKNGKNSENRD